MRRAANATRANAWGWLLSCMGVLGVAPAASAQGSTASDAGSKLNSDTSSGVGYRVPRECPNFEHWNAALQARLPGGSAAARITERSTIEIRRVGNAHSVEYVGTLDAQTGARSRQVRGSSCAEVVEALSLVAALVSQPDSAPPRDSEAASDAWLLTPTEELALLQDRPPPTPAAAGPAGFRLGLSAFALLETTAAPTLGVNYGVGGSLQWNAGAFEPWVFAGIYRGAEERVGVPGSSAFARFGRWSTYLVGCPLRVLLSATAALRPCLDLDLGRLTGEGLDVGEARRRHAPLASAGLELRLEWSPLPALQLSGMFGGVAPLTRSRFFFRPERTSFEVAPVGLRAGALASLLF